MWQFFDKHWLLALIIIICVTALLDNILTIINNCVRVWFVKSSRSKGDVS